MTEVTRITNIVVAGLGGQGVLTASDMVASVAFNAGLEVKKSEIHGMSQRGGSVSSDIRFGAEVLSPMVPPGAADYLLVLAEDQIEVNRHALRAGGVLIAPYSVEQAKLRNKKSLNVALLGVLSRHLEFAEDLWKQAIRDSLPEKLHRVNLEAFQLGRSS